MSPGQRIAKARKALGMTQVKLAGLAGITSEFVSQIESGTKGFSPEVAARLSAALQGRVGAPALVFPDGLPDGASWDGPNEAPDLLPTGTCGAE